MPTTTTTTTTPLLDRPVSSPELLRITSRQGLGAGVAAKIWVALLAGGALLAISFHLAAGGDNSAHFLVFWAGMLLGVLALAVPLVSQSAAVHERVMAVMALGIFTTLPKLLRNFSGPLFHDEFAHLRQANELLATGQVGQPNTLVRMAEQFPGLHLVTAAISRVTGLSPWSSGLVVVVCAHLLALLGFYLLVRQVSDSPRVAGVASLIYTANSSWMFFDTQFAYESLALPFMIWTLVLAVRLWRRPEERRPTRVLAVIGLAAATMITHHLTGILLFVMLGWFDLVVQVRSRAGAPAQDGSRRALLLRAAAWICAFVLIAAFAFGSFDSLWRYLSPSLERGFSQLGSLFGQRAAKSNVAGGGHRSLFHGTHLPPYEVISSLAMPFVLLGAMWLSRRAWRKLSPPGFALAALAPLYFLSLPLLLTEGGAEGARRTWAFSFMGLSLVLAVGVCEILAGRPWRRIKGMPVALVLAGAFVVVSVGNVAGGQNEAYRFPGPYQLGNDARSLDAETLALADWTRANLGSHNVFLADRYTGMPLAAAGGQDLISPSPSYPIWDILFSAETPSELLVRRIQDGEVAYLVVDERMAEIRPALGYWFTRDEPNRGGDTLVPRAALQRLDCVAWAEPIYGSEHLRLYRLKLDRFNAEDTARVMSAIQQRGSCQ